MLWIGTAMGLSRYDGSGFHTYSVADGLPAPRVRDIEMDDDGLLWLATANGIARLDPRTDSITAWEVAGTSADGRAEVDFNAVRRLANGKVLCSGLYDAYLFDPTSGDLRRLAPDFPGPVLVHGPSLLLDSAGRGCWLATRDIGVSYYDAVHDRLLHKEHDPGRHPLLQGLESTRIVRDNDGVIWLDEVPGGGMYAYMPHTRQLRHWSHVPGAPERRYPGGILALIQDRQGRYWLGDWAGNPLLFDPRDSTVVPIPFVPEDPSTIVDPTITAVAMNERGQVWLGTLNGLAVYDPDRFVVKRFSMADRSGGGAPFLTGLAEDDRGHVWVGGTHGVTRVHGPDGGGLRARWADGREVMGVHDLVRAHGSIWATYGEGLLRIDPATGRTERVVHAGDPGLGRLAAGAIAVDGRGRLWTTRQGGRIHCYDPSTGMVREFLRDSLMRTGPPPGAISALLCAADGTLWIGHQEHGLVRMDPETGRCQSSIRGPADRGDRGRRVLAVAEDADARIWYLADGVGLVRYEPSNGRYTVYDARHGMPIPAGSGIVVDGNGILWVALLNGVVRFDPVAERFTRINVDHGQRYNDIGRGVMLRHNGEVWMTNMGDLLHFDAAAFRQARAPMPPVVTLLRAGDQRHMPDSAGTVRLPYDQNRIRIGFVSFDAPGHITTYALRQGDGAWHEGAEGDVTIDNLPPGDHRFQLRTRADDGQWSAPTALRLLIDPPWWQRTWARIGGALLLAAAIVLVFRLRLNWIRRRERREEAVARTINELKLRALRAQMNPHFVFNCMNSIDKFILMNEPEQASHYLNRFAMLVRLILNQSDHVSVALEKEVELLRYYLELEALRFEEPFTFAVVADPLLVNEEPELPAMLVQPYVENAIWHGLQHRRGPGHIRVDFRKQGDSMMVIVEDNGVGRAEAARINARRTAMHSSRAMQVNADRMRLLEELKHGGASVTIEDLADRDGTALGTRVNITLPLEALHE